MRMHTWEVEKPIKVDGLVMESGGEVMVGGIRGGTRGQGGVVVNMYPRSTISMVLCTSWGVMKILVLLIDSNPKCPPNPTTAPNTSKKHASWRTYSWEVPRVLKNRCVVRRAHAHMGSDVGGAWERGCAVGARPQWIPENTEKLRNVVIRSLRTPKEKGRGVSGDRVLA